MIRLYMWVCKHKRKRSVLVLSSWSWRINVFGQRLRRVDCFAAHMVTKFTHSTIQTRFVTFFLVQLFIFFRSRKPVLRSFVTHPIGRNVGMFSSLTKNSSSPIGTSRNSVLRGGGWRVIQGTTEKVCKSSHEALLCSLTWCNFLCQARGNFFSVVVCSTAYFGLFIWLLIL